jgi:hypothetical protein
VASSVRSFHSPESERRSNLHVNALFAAVAAFVAAGAVDFGAVVAADLLDMDDMYHARIIRTTTPIDPSC